MNNKTIKATTNKNASVQGKGKSTGKPRNKEVFKAKAVKKADIDSILNDIKVTYQDASLKMYHIAEKAIYLQSVCASDVDASDVYAKPLTYEFIADECGVDRSNLFNSIKAYEIIKARKLTKDVESGKMSFSVEKIIKADALNKGKKGAFSDLLALNVKTLREKYSTMKDGKSDGKKAAETIDIDIRLAGGKKYETRRISKALYEEILKADIVKK